MNLTLRQRQLMAKPCPYCGNVPTTSKAEGKKYFYIQCFKKTCPAKPTVSGTVMKQVVTNWNKPYHNVMNKYLATPIGSRL